jgi:uridylate kinase
MTNTAKTPNDTQQVVVISLGGSLIVPEEIDIPFLQAFKRLITRRIALGERFMIVIGGGKTCRKYQAALKEVREATMEDVDWIGIHSLRFNGQLIRLMFKEHAHGDIVNRPEDVPATKTSIIIGGAWKPGCSSDLDAITFADVLGAKKVINLSNIDYAYDKDPRKHKDAQPIKEITWAEYRNLIPSEWSPGLNTPFDPVASKKAEELGIEVAIMNGKNIDNLEHYLNGGAFNGTIIR